MEFVQSYLACFLTARTVNPESAYLVLSHTQASDILAKALEELLKAQDQRAIAYLVEQMNAGRFSDADAQRVLEPFVAFSVKTLIDLPATLARDRLLVCLVETNPRPDLVVFPGYWVRSDAGWGCIDEIRQDTAGPARGFFLPTRETPYLVVTLRADYAPEIIHLDLAQQELKFPYVKQVYLCTHSDGCEHFMSEDMERVLREHNHIAHHGIGASMRPLDASCRRLHHSLEYCAQRPQNPFA